MKTLTSTLAFLALAVSATAQQVQPGTPATAWADFQGDIPTTVVASPDVEQLLLEDEARQHRPLRYGEVIEAHVDVNSAGRWDEAPDGTLVWRMRVTSPGAFSLGVVFDQFNLKPGEEVFFYNADRSTVFGSYTAMNNQPNLQLGVQPFPGDTMTVEYVRQPWVQGTPQLSIGSITHDYRNVLNPGQFVGGACLIGINCPQGANYQDEKRAVFRTLAGGSLCSAALLNNTSEDETAYFLTAEHCGNMTNGTFRFNFEDSNCGTANGPTNNQVSGATLLAASTSQDSQLYRINPPIPVSFDVYYLGWNRANSSLSGQIVTIGHGGGAPKNMAIDNNGASTSGSNDWLVDWSDGYIIGGNSGGPLLDSSGRAIGPACCVNNFTCGQQVAWYGRLGRFWSGSNLGQWLDPQSNGSITLAGLDNGNGGTGGPGCSGPLAIASVTPAIIDALIPGTDKTIVIDGCGFSPTSQVLIDGVTVTGIPSPVEFIDSATLRFNMPELDSLGFKTLTVQNGTDTINAGIIVQAPVTPKLQVGTGDDGNLIFSFAGLEVKFGGQPGDLHLLVYSTSNVPSSAPTIVELLLGNNFSNVPQVGLFAIPAKGWDSLSAPVTSAGQIVTVYSQSINLGNSAPLSFPLQSSNLQEFSIL